MAGKKKHGKGHHGKKVGKLRMKKENPLATAALTLVGAGGTMAVDTMALKTTKGWQKGVGAMVLGGAVAWKVRNHMAKAIGTGVAVWGGIRLLISLTGTSISGCNSVSGFRDVPAIGQNNPIRRFPQPSAVGNRRTRMAAAAGAGM